MTSPDGTSQVRLQKSETVTKAVRLLDEFLTRQRPLTLGQLAQNTGIHKTTVFRLCNSLLAADLLQRSGQSAFFIGPKVWHLARIYQQAIDAESLIRPHLVHLRDETSESASFYIKDGDWRICLFRENARHAVRHHLEEGARLALSEGVVGHVLLAFSGEPGEEYERIRRDGHLIAQGREPYTASVAVPCMAANDELIGAVVVSGPSARFGVRNRQRALTLVHEAAQAIRAQVADARVLFPARGGDVPTRDARKRSRATAAG